MNHICKSPRAILAVVFLLFACSHKPKLLPPVPAFDKVNGEPTANADAGRGRSEGKAFADMVYMPKMPVVYFAFDSDKISKADAEDMSYAAMATKAKWSCQVDGFASEEGTKEYNLSLGARRAHAVALYLTSFHGIAAHETSYGEERQAATPELSRRVEIRCE